MQENDTIAHGANLLAKRAGSLFNSADSAVWRRELQTTCSDAAIEWWLQASTPVKTKTTTTAFDRFFDRETRRANGIYFTPSALSQIIADRVPKHARTVLDPACGDGALLEAVAKTTDAAVIGVEQEPLLVVAAALRLLRLRRREGDFVHWADGLDPTFWDVDVVVSNPPYVPEKGNKELLAQTKRRHPDLARCFRARMDLFYFFMARAAITRRRSVFLTSDYWLTADSGSGLRELLAEVGVRRLQRIGAGQFVDAPGHHSLITDFGEHDGKTTAVGLDGCEHQVEVDGRTWTPFASIAKRQGVRLGDLVTDFQGVVSGADRVTKRNAARCVEPVGTSIFIRKDPTAELPWLPLLRGSTFEAQEVVYELRDELWMLYLDGSESLEESEEAKRYLHPFREILSARREVKQGKMDWTRLHWPRQIDNFRRPKLVVPRRASTCRFALDLAGHVVSSDCTVLNAPADCPQPIRHLVHLMTVLNDESTADYLRAFGKMKGEMIEFYATPLRDLPVPVVDEQGVATAEKEALYLLAEGLLSEIYLRAVGCKLLDDESNREVVLTR